MHDLQIIGAIIVLAICLHLIVEYNRRDTM